jgi:hypothetical protein
MVDVDMPRWTWTDGMWLASTTSVLKKGIDEAMLPHVAVVERRTLQPVYSPGTTQQSSDQEIPSLVFELVLQVRIPKLNSIVVTSDAAAETFYAP